MPKLKSVKPATKKLKIDFLAKIFTECFSELEMTKNPQINLHLALIKLRIEPDFENVVRCLSQLQASEEFGIYVQIAVSELMGLE